MPEQSQVMGRACHAGKLASCGGPETLRAAGRVLAGSRIGPDRAETGDSVKGDV
jgi:hypothetical protein